MICVLTAYLVGLLFSCHGFYVQHPGISSIQAYIIQGSLHATTVHTHIHANIVIKEKGLISKKRDQLSLVLDCCSSTCLAYKLKWGITFHAASAGGVNLMAHLLVIYLYQHVLIAASLCMSVCTRAETSESPCLLKVTLPAASTWSKMQNLTTTRSLWAPYGGTRAHLLLHNLLGASRGQIWL